ncbi:hypothetical protein [Devosia sp.]|uniref:hypothetical protein n=1 Tax=Devosia sp. TaxID=1871048 RepID=UPI002FC9CDE4
MTTRNPAILRGGNLPPQRRHVFAGWLIATVAICSNSPVHAEHSYAVRTVWDEYTESDLNISVFVFRDANRNGIYDLEDRPMSGISIDSSGVGQPASAISNSSGFANFTMSGTDRGADIKYEGSYQFDVQVPPRWAVTTGNERQTTRFELFPGSPADLVARPAPALVGLAPDLWIEGHSAKPLTLAARSAGTLQEAMSNEAGNFTFPVRPGNWQISSPTMPKPRQIAIAATPVRLTESWLLQQDPPSEIPSIEATFDDLQSEGVLKIPSGYMGLDWSNFVMTHQKFYEPEGYRNGVLSGEFLAYNGSGHPATISRDKPFDFVGGYFGVSTLRAEGETLIITGWHDEQEVYRESMALSALGPIFLAADFRGVTRVEFTTEHYWQFTSDNLTFRLN